jgi:hypothetical protein
MKRKLSQDKRCVVADIDAAAKQINKCWALLTPQARSACLRLAHAISDLRIRLLGGV